MRAADIAEVSPNSIAIFIISDVIMLFNIIAPITINAFIKLFPFGMEFVIDTQR